MHRNCHEFLKTNSIMTASRKSVNNIKPVSAHLEERFSMIPSSQINSTSAF